jgi:hypothetical protein
MTAAGFITFSASPPTFYKNGLVSFQKMPHRFRTAATIIAG